MSQLNIKDNVDKMPHIFRSYDWDDREGWKESLAERLVPIIRELYLDCEGLKKGLQDIGVLGEKKIKDFIDHCIKTNIPTDSTDNSLPENFKIRRADFAELMSLICLEELHDTCIPTPNLFFRELTHAPGRGVDVLGYEQVEDSLSLIICEVKGSKEDQSPPRVVDQGVDSLHSQLYSYVSNRQKTLNRILNVRKKASPEHKEVLTKIAFWWCSGEDSPLRVVVCPFMVRQADCYTVDDFGKFKDDPEIFSPAHVRFLIVCVHYDLVNLSEMIYNKAGKLDG